MLCMASTSIQHRATLISAFGARTAATEDDDVLESSVGFPSLTLAGDGLSHHLQ
jgi:hypothetical protein